MIKLPRNNFSFLGFDYVGHLALSVGENGKTRRGGFFLDDPVYKSAHFISFIFFLHRTDWLSFVGFFSSFVRPWIRVCRGHRFRFLVSNWSLGGRRWTDRPPAAVETFRSTFESSVVLIGGDASPSSLRGPWPPLGSSW